jgi:hypothetical protein
MNREPQEPEQVDPKRDEEQPCSEAELKQVNGGVQTRQKGSAPGFGPGTSIEG